MVPMNVAMTGASPPLAHSACQAAARAWHRRSASPSEDAWSMEEADAAEEVTPLEEMWTPPPPMSGKEAVGQGGDGAAPPVAQDGDAAAHALGQKRRI